MQQPKPLTQQRIEEWVKMTTGVFSLRDIYADLGLTSEELKVAVRIALHRLCGKNIVVSLDSRDGLYRLVDIEAPIIDWKGANVGDYFSMKWPFKLEKYIVMPRRSIAVVGGTWNAGKSALAHNLVNLNFQEHRVFLFDSEHNAVELRDRLSKFPDWQSFPTDFIKERSQHFEDVIDPDALNIIDYLEITQDFYEVGGHLRRIRDRLNQGIAIVMLQKPRGRDLPVGKDQAMQLARLVLVLDPGLLTILKAKNWTQRNVNPNGKTFNFKLLNGETFIVGNE